MKLINFSHPKTAPKAARTGSKTAKIIEMAGRPEGVTLTALANAMNRIGGKELDAHTVRAWVAPSYLQELGYGIKSEPTKDGKDIRIFLTSSGKAVDTSRSDVAKKPAKKSSKKKTAAKKVAEKTEEPATEKVA